MIASTSAILGFAAASFAIAVSPGPSWAYVISTTVKYDRKTGLIAVLGNGTGIVCHVLAATSGLSVLLTYSASVYTTAKWLGALYLIYLGVRMMLQQPGEKRRAEPHTTISGDQVFRVVFREGVFVNLLNPKVALLMLALLPQFVDASAGHVGLQTLLIGSLHVVIASLGLGTLVYVVGAGTTFVRPTPRFRRVTRFVAGSILFAFGLTIAASGRS